MSINSSTHPSGAMLYINAVLSYKMARLEISGPFMIGIRSQYYGSLSLTSATMGATRGIYLHSLLGKKQKVKIHLHCYSNFNTLLALVQIPLLKLNGVSNLIIIIFNKEIIDVRTTHLIFLEEPVPRGILVNKKTAVKIPYSFYHG